MSSGTQESPSFDRLPESIPVSRRVTYLTEGKSPLSQQYVWADILRVAASFGVVLVHASFPFVLSFHPSPPLPWWIGNLYDSMARASVPLFFMLTGFLLLGRTEPLGLYFRKRLLKVVLPFVVWSLLYLLWRRYGRQEQFAVGPTVLELWQWPAYYHLWFMTALLQIYLLVPLLRRAVARLRPIWLLLLPALCFELILLKPLWERFVYSEPLFEVMVLLGYLGYCLAGYRCGSLGITSRMIVPAGLLYAGAVALTAVGTWILSQYGGRFNPYLYGYLSPSTIVMALAAFLLLRAVAQTRAFQSVTVGRDWPRRLSELSFGIYLVHPLVMETLLGGVLSPARASAGLIVVIPVVAVIVFVISALVVWLLRRVPLLRAIVP